MAVVAFLVFSLMRASTASAVQDDADGKAFGRYIVVLEDSVQKPGEVANRQMSVIGGHVHGVYHYALVGYAASLPKNAVDSLRNDPRVAYVTVDHPVSLMEAEPGTQAYKGEIVKLTEATIPTGVQRAFAASNKALAINGKEDLHANVDVAVIDTGIYYTHPDLNVAMRTSCLSSSCVDNSGQDVDSHGTAVAGIIGARDNGEGVVGMAPGARLWAVRVYNNFGGSFESWMVAGVDWVTAHAKEIEVANMSLGCECSMPALEKAITTSTEAGVVYSVAAGNERTDASKISPAKNPNVITVSALADYDGKPGGKAFPTCEAWGEDDHKAIFSNYGSTIELVAPGLCTLSTLTEGRYGYFGGTSAAAPHVAGAAALLASHNNPNSLKDVEAIRQTLIEKGNKEWTDDSGDGIQEPLLDVSDESKFWFVAPKATTGPASEIKSEEATLNATVNPSGAAAVTYQFEYGTTTKYGSKAPASPKSAGSGSEDIAVKETISGLSPETTYHYRVVADNGEGTVYGEDATFTAHAISPTSLFEFGGQGSDKGQFQWPRGIAVDSSGNVWVSDYTLDRVQKFNEKGEYQLQFGAEGNGEGQLNHPTGMAVTPGGDLWVVDSGNDRVQKFDSEGKYLGQFGTPGEKDGQFGVPWDIAIAPDGSIWVSDIGYDKIQKFTSSGGFLTKAGGLGSGDGQFSDPTGIATDAAGNLWVTDRGNNRMQKLSSAGAFLFKFGSKGTTEGQFEEPHDVVVLPNGNLLVAEHGEPNHRVQQFTPNGQALGKISEWGPEQIALGRGGKFFIPGGSSRKVHVWGLPGKPEATTEAPSNIKSKEATLNATVNPRGFETTYQFEYGTTTAYGSKAPASPGAVGSDFWAHADSQSLTSLTSGQTYHYRVVATSAKGTTYGEDKAFTTMHLPQFEAAEYPATLGGGQESSSILFTIQGSTASCKKATLSGTQSSFSATLTVVPSFSECTTFGAASGAINPNGCSFTLHAGSKWTAQYVGSVDVGCPAGKAIEISGGNCAVSISAQSGLNTVGLTNAGSPSTVKASLEAAKLKYNVTNDGFGCPLSGVGAGEDGTLGGTAVISATNSAKAAVALSVSGDEEESHSPTVEAEKYPAPLVAEQESGLSPLVFSIQGSNATCAKVTGSGTQSLASTQLAFGPTFSECTSFGFTSSTISVNGCSFAFNAGSALGGGKYSATLGLTCPEGKALEITTSACAVTIPSQSNLSGSSLTNTVKSSREALIAGFSTSSLKYNVTKDNFGCPLSGVGSGENGGLTGSLMTQAKGTLPVYGLRVTGS